MTDAVGGGVSVGQYGGGALRVSLATYGWCECTNVDGLNDTIAATESRATPSSREQSPTLLNWTTSEKRRYKTRTL